MNSFARLLSLSVTALMLSATVALADPLSDAKSAGQVGELPSGYLGIVVPNPSADIRALVSNINAARKAEYQRIAEKNGQPLNVIERLAGEKVVEKAPPGQFVQTGDGLWVKK